MSEPTNPIEEMNYEQAFAELESILNTLETDQTSLEEAIAIFERGQALAKHCAMLLDQAELRIRQLNTGELLEMDSEEPEE